MFGSSNEMKSMESKVCSEIGCIKIHWNHVLLNKSANFKAFFLIFQVRLDENITMTTTFTGDNNFRWCKKNFFEALYLQSVAQKCTSKTLTKV